MSETLSKRTVAYGLVGSLILAGAVSCSRSSPKPQSKSVKCEGISLWLQSDRTYDAQVRWQQIGAPDVDTMQFTYFDGKHKHTFPLSLITAAVQTLPLTASHEGGKTEPYVDAVLTDTSGAISTCPPVSVVVH